MYNTMTMASLFPNRDDIYSYPPGIVVEKKVTGKGLVVM
jgi:hypothetical protein